MTGSLNIKVVPFGDNADLIINGKHYVIETARIRDEMDLRLLVRDQPDYIYAALIGILREMSL